MQKIASFTVDHDRLRTGMYISRIDFEDIATYDIRMKVPNRGSYLSCGAAHTLEHLFATYARNSSFASHIVYVGPMGCRTGFYLITKSLSHSDALRLVQDSMAFIRDFSGPIPGATRPECGNYLEQDLYGAQAVANDMLRVLADWDEAKMVYTALLP